MQRLYERRKFKMPRRSKPLDRVSLTRKKNRKTRLPTLRRLIRLRLSPLKKTRLERPRQRLTRSRRK